MLYQFEHSIANVQIGTTKTQICCPLPKHLNTGVYVLHARNVVLLEAFYMYILLPIINMLRLIEMNTNDSVCFLLNRF